MLPPRIENEKDVLDQNVINLQSYRDNQSKLKIVNKNRINYAAFIHDKSSDKFLRMIHNVTQDFVVNVFDVESKPKHLNEVAKRKYLEKLRTVKSVTSITAELTACCVYTDQNIKKESLSKNLSSSIVPDSERDVFK